MNKQPSTSAEKPMPQKPQAAADKSGTSKPQAGKAATKPDTSKTHASPGDAKQTSKDAEHH